MADYEDFDDVLASEEVSIKLINEAVKALDEDLKETILLYLECGVPRTEILLKILKELNYDR